MRKPTVTFAILLAALWVAPFAWGQQPVATDTAALRGMLEARRHAVLRIEGPTVIRLVLADAEPEPDSIRAALEAAAARQGFAYVVRVVGTVETITDPAFASVHYLPADQRSGYLIIAPGQRARTVPGRPDPTRLESAIRDYRRVIRQLR